jgi:hexokinase
MLDRQSINPGFQAFEKFISGMYLGEITRHVLLSLVDATPKALAFSGKASIPLNRQWGLDTSVMSEVEEAWEGPFSSLPPFGSWDDSKLDAASRAKLEKVRQVVIKSLEYQDQDVSLLDAAVRP